MMYETSLSCCLGSRREEEENPLCVGAMPAVLFTGRSGRVSHCVQLALKQQPD